MDTLSRVTKSLLTIREMLTDRGIDTAPLDRYGPDELRVFVEDTTHTAFRLPITDTYVIIYIMTPKFKIAEFRSIMLETFKKVLCVVHEPPTAHNLKLITEEFDYCDLQFFTLRELQYNVTKHVYVPRHTPVRDPEDIKRILVEHQVTSKAQLPWIHKTDPLARYFDLKPGELVHISRASLSSGEYICYRVCV